MNTPTLHDILAQIESLKRDKALQPQINMLAIEQRITAATQQAVLDINLKGELQAALGARQDARMVLDRIAAIDARLKVLNEQREIAEYEQAKSQRLSAENEVNEALNEFRMLARQVVRAYRRIATLNTRNRAMGASTVPLPGFSFDHLRSDPRGSFSTSDEMNMGLLRFEVQEQQQQKEAA